MNKGCDPKGIDGIFGVNTEKATKKFQKANGLVVDGKIGPKTKEKLFAKEDISEEKYHIVQSGEDLGKIARKEGTTVEELIRLNPQIKNPNLIYPGDKIRIA